VLRQWNEINPAYKVKGAPQVGDIFIMDFGGGHGHTGFVTKVYEGRIETLEGNSNADGSREGYEVCSKPNGRPISSIKGFIRLPF
jgi:CHAP domain